MLKTISLSAGLVSVLAFAQLALAQPALAQDAKKGREIFVKVGCYSCHGYNGQGGVAGPKLAPKPLEADAIANFVRNARSTRMPAYVEAVLSDEDIGHIRAWLASQPEARNYKEVPLLNN